MNNLTPPPLPLSFLVSGHADVAASVLYVPGRDPGDVGGWGGGRDVLAGGGGPVVVVGRPPTPAHW